MLQKLFVLKCLRNIVQLLKGLIFLNFYIQGAEPSANLESNAEVENEIRNMLLKAGKKAFVEENSKAFLEVAVIKDIILNAGGYPLHTPLLADNSKGEYTQV